MPFKGKAETFNASIATLDIGTGEKTIRLGGQNVLPLYAFDASLENPPRIGVEISDEGLEGYTPKLLEYYAGVSDVVSIAKKAAAMEGADFVCLRLDSADPNGKNTSIEDCVTLAKEVCSAIDKPLAIMGCRNVEKDGALFEKLAEALQGQNVLLLSAREEDYKKVGASGLAYNQKVGAESAVDINLAKQLNVLLTQLGVAPKNIAMNLGSAAAGYGFEYVASTMERVKSAALGQNDTMLQMPVVTPVALETWAVKESIVPENEVPEWGDMEERAIHMETVTAMACLASGSDAVILRHPVSVSKISALLGALL